MGHKIMTREQHETDWVANSVYGFGYGYTKEQALLNMSQHAYPGESKEKVEVTLVEHVGSVTAGPGTLEVEEFVSGERVRIPAGKMRELSSIASEASKQAELVLDSAEREELEHE